MSDGELSGQTPEEATSGQLISWLNKETRVRPLVGYVACLALLNWVLAGGVQFGLNGAAFLSRTVDEWSCFSALANATEIFTDGNCSSWRPELCASLVHGYHNQETVAAKFDLLCERKDRLLIAQILFAAGLLFGGIFAGWLSDFAGRRTAALTGQIALIIAGVWTILSPNFACFAASRFAAGMAAHTAILSSLVLAVETVPARFRNLFTPLVSISFIGGLCLLTLVGYLLQSDWTDMDVTTWCLVCPLVPLTWLAPESPRWLFVKGKHSQLATVMDRLKCWPYGQAPEREGAAADETVLVATASFSVSVQSEQGQRIEQGQRLIPSESQSQSRCAITKLFHRKLRFRTISVFWIWLTASSIYFGLVFGKTGVTGGLYLNFFLISIVELPAALLSMWTYRRFGRRQNMVGWSLLSLTAIIVSVGVFWAYPQETSKPTLKLVIALCMKFAVSVVFATLLLYAPELFPTDLRALGVAVVSSASSIGAALSPLLITVGLSAPGAMLSIKTVMLVVSLFLAFRLPETKNRPLPDSLDDM